MTHNTGAPVPTSISDPSESELPPLSQEDFHIFNRKAEWMDGFHNHFRAAWNLLYSASTASKRPAGMSVRQFINTGLDFCRHLTFHHDIEEATVFPVLGRRMPAFRDHDELKGQHRKIHAGLMRMQAFLEACADGKSELRLEELKGIMDSFGGHLWQHLDEEVETLGAENMRKYWSKEEMTQMRFH